MHYVNALDFTAFLVQDSEKLKAVFPSLWVTSALKWLVIPPVT